MTRNDTTGNINDNTEESESPSEGRQHRRKQNQKTLEVNPGSSIYKGTQPPAGDLTWNLRLFICKLGILITF